MELEINGKLNKVRKGSQRYNFPTCTIMRTGPTYFCYLNRAARNVWTCDKGVNWYENDGNIIALPSDAINAYHPVSKNGILSGYTFPQILINQGKVKLGVYRLYRCKSGFGIQPYKPLEVKEVKDA